MSQYSYRPTAREYATPVVALPGCPTCGGYNPPTCTECAATQAEIDPCGTCCGYTRTCPECIEHMALVVPAAAAELVQIKRRACHVCGGCNPSWCDMCAEGAMEAQGLAEAEHWATTRQIVW